MQTKSDRINVTTETDIYMQEGSLYNTSMQNTQAFKESHAYQVIIYSI